MDTDESRPLLSVSISVHLWFHFCVVQCFTVTTCMVPKVAAAVLLVSWTLFGQSAAVQEKSARAKAAMSSRNFEEAVRLYTELVRELPAVPGMKMNLGMAYCNTGKFNESVKYLTLAVQANPSLAQAWLLLGSAQFESGR